MCNIQQHFGRSQHTYTYETVRLPRNTTLLADALGFNWIIPPQVMCVYVRVCSAVLGMTFGAVLDSGELNRVANYLLYRRALAGKHVCQLQFRPKKTTIISPCRLA